MPPSSCGGNPMRWNCEQRGCFNVKKRPKIEVFSSCFERGINFGDVDGIVESRGHFLLLEWKPGPGAVGKGQALLHCAILKIHQFTLIEVHGDAETMAVSSFVVRHGTGARTVQGGLAALKSQIREWFAWAERQPRAA
jgi:hypothetical protein